MDTRKINEKYAEIAAELIETEPTLQDLKDSNVQIIYLSSRHKKMQGGSRIFGQCEKIAEKYKWGIPCDFTITVFEPNVIACDFTEEQIKALIHHELLHVGIDVQETLLGVEESYYVRSHDLEDFRAILQKYGIDWAHSNA